jgi:hypothetical protein
MDYAKEYHSDAIIAARGVFDETVKGIIDGADRRLVSGAPNQSGVQLITDSLFTALTQDEFQTSVRSMLNFYEEIYSCEQSNICDKDTALSMFARDGRNFLNSFTRFVFGAKALERRRSGL